MKGNKQTDSRYEEFSQNYSRTNNATEAAKAAGYSESTAGSKGNQLLKIVDIQDRIQELKETRLDGINMDHERIMRDLKAFVYADLTQTLVMTVEDVKRLPLEVRLMVTGTTQHFETTEIDGKNTRVVSKLALKFMNKEKIWDMINRHGGFYEADNAQKKPDIHVGDKVVNLHKLSDETLLEMERAAS